jgi:hypothetical protein
MRDCALVLHGRKTNLDKATALILRPCRST